LRASIGTYLRTFSVSGFEDHLRCHAGLVGFDPAQHVQAPAVSGRKPEAHLGARRGEIVAARAAELEKLFGRLDADQVRDAFGIVRRAAAVAKESGERIVAAGEQRSAEHVLFFDRTELMGRILSGKPDLKSMRRESVFELTRSATSPRRCSA